MISLRRTGLAVLLLTASCLAAVTPEMMLLSVSGQEADGATVTIDGRQAGTMPLRELPITSKFHRLRVLKRGYLPYDTFVMASRRHGSTQARVIVSVKLVPLDPAGANRLSADLGCTSTFDIQLACGDSRPVSKEAPPKKSASMDVRPGVGIGPISLYAAATPLIRSYKLDLIQDCLPGKLRLYSGQGLSLLVGADDAVLEISIGRGPLASQYPVRTPQGRALGPKASFDFREFDSSWNIGDWTFGVENISLKRGVLARFDNYKQTVDSIAVFPPKPPGWRPSDR